MTNSTVSLRPLTLSDLLDSVFRLYRNNFLTFVGIAALLQVPLLLLQMLLGLALNRRVSADMLRLLDELPRFNPNRQSFTELPIDSLLIFVGVTLIVALIQGVVVQQLVSGALANAIARRYLGEAVTVTGAYSFGIGRAVALIVAGLITALIGGLVVAVIFGAMFLAMGFTIASLPSRTGALVAVIVFVGAVMLALAALLLAGLLLVRFIFVTQVVVLEGRGPLAALGRSWQLLSGSYWRALGIVVILYLLVQVLTFLPSLALGGVIGVVFGDPEDFVLQQSLSTLVGYSIQIFVLPLQLLGYTLLYFDLRVRKEGLDLQLRAQQAAAPEAPFR